MSGEVSFRAASTVAPVTDSGGNTSTSSTTGSEVAVEVPYLDYERSNSKPFTVEFFGLGDTWKDPTGGFPSEISIIEDYFQDKINSGDIANSVSAVKDRLKEILKVTNMSKEERNVIKIEIVASYIKFLQDSDNIRHSVKRYGSTK